MEGDDISLLAQFILGVALFLQLKGDPDETGGKIEAVAQIQTPGQARRRSGRRRIPDPGPFSWGVSHILQTNVRALHREDSPPRNSWGRSGFAVLGNRAIGFIHRFGFAQRLGSTPRSAIPHAGKSDAGRHNGCRGWTSLPVEIQDPPLMRLCWVSKVGVEKSS